MRRRIALVAGALVAALALSACGAKKDALTPAATQTQPLNLMLDWLPNADHAGLYAALANGDFGQAGLAVHVRAPTDPATPLQLLAAGKVDAAISYEPQLLLARDAGEPLVAIAAIVQRPLTSIISLHSKHITTAGQLRGKRIGDAGIPYQQAYLKTILAHAGVPAHTVKDVNVGANLVPAMVSGRVDATLGAYWNYEAIQLRQDGKRPNVIHVEDVGVPTYDELVVVVRENEIANQNGELRRFVQALGRGYQAVRANPQAGVDALVHANPSLSAKLQLASVKATLTSFFPTRASLPWGWQNERQWTAFGEWMLRQHLIKNASTIANASTNQLLAGQGP
ncbi:MAG TPA: ABC transporter substrate-binding protein [Solirubrobacteraceae bacterium]|jgi:putative hydroxymethylpyrimidine transport system substrate-binding protein